MFRKNVEDPLKVFSFSENARIFVWALVISLSHAYSRRAEMLAVEWLTDRACWPPKDGVLIIEPQPPQTLVILPNSNWKGQIDCFHFWMCGGCKVKRCIAMKKKQQYSCWCLSCCSYIYMNIHICVCTVQNVYQACAYIGMTFTTNIIWYNFYVNVLKSNCVGFFFFFNIFWYHLQTLIKKWLQLTWKWCFLINLSSTVFNNNLPISYVDKDNDLWEYPVLDLFLQISTVLICTN